MSQVKGSYAGDIGWNAAAGEHAFFNRRRAAPDRYQSLPLGYTFRHSGAFAGANASTGQGTSHGAGVFETDAPGTMRASLGGYASDRHTLFSTVADRRHNRVDGMACTQVATDVHNQFLRLPGVPSSAFYMKNTQIGGLGGRGDGGIGGSAGGRGGRAKGVGPDVRR